VPYWAGTQRVSDQAPAKERPIIAQDEVSQRKSWMMFWVGLKKIQAPQRQPAHTRSSPPVHFSFSNRSAAL
jgi:hypothetical protein